LKQFQTVFIFLYLSGQIKSINQSKVKNLSDVQQLKNRYNKNEQMIKLGMLNIISLTSKALIVNDMITDYNLARCAVFDRNHG